MDHEPPDPPMEPQSGTAVWFESGPEPLLQDPELAVVMVSVGMASNALNAQSFVVRHAHDDFAARRTRDVLSALVTSAALTQEATKLAKGHMGVLRRFAAEAGARDELLQEIGRLCGGHHPASSILRRARNKIGFHWEEAVIAPSVRDFGKNKSLVWLEASEDDPVHRLASDVLAHVLLDASNQISQQDMEAQLDQISKAMQLMTEFFTASTYGYLKSIQAVRMTRQGENEGRAPSDG